MIKPKKQTTDFQPGTVTHKGRWRPLVRKVETFPPVTMAHIRSHGCRDLLIYCGSGRCHHSASMSGDAFPDDLPVRSLCGRMVCTKCGMIGADVRPDWSPHVNKRHI